MKKVGIIADIHSNLEALQRVIEDMVANNVTKVFCLGDIVGYGPFPKECLEIVRKLADKIVRGNHEDSVLDLQMAEEKMKKLAFFGIQFSQKRLPEDDLAYIRSLPVRHIVKDLDLALAHGSYTETDEESSAWHYIEEEEDALSILNSVPARICVVGHTHMPFLLDSKNGLHEVLPDNLELEKDSKYLINVGSVGQPRDGDCRASYGLFEFDGARVSFNLQRVFYDIGKAEASFRNAGLPAYLSERLFKGE